MDTLVMLPASVLRHMMEPGLGYAFRDRSLLQRALRHASSGPENNERLEFLGDAVLDLLSAEHLFKRFPDAREGMLSEARAEIVRERTLAAHARRLGLGPLLVVGRGSEHVRERDRALADALEALVGAAFEDGGLDAARAMATACGILG